MSSLVPAPEGATCANHPETPASWTCGRCGSFMCPDCERRVRPEAVPMCAACWELRARTVTPQNISESGTALLTIGLVLGVISLLPAVALQICSLVVNIMALVRAKESPAREKRWRSVVGLCLTGVGVVVDVIFFAGLAN